MIFKHQLPNFIYMMYRRFRYLYLNDTSPVVASIKVTQRCNLRCSHCTWVNKVTNDLPLARWKQIIDTIYDRGCFVIFIEGGEPTLRDDLPEIVKYIKAKGMGCVMFSNGTRGLPDTDVDAVWISIDGTEESHDAVRGKGNYKKVMRTLERYPEKNIFSLTTLSKTNAPEIEAICKELSSTSLKGMIFNFMYPYKDISSKVLPKAERVDIARELMGLKKKYPKIISSDSYLKTVGQPDKICYPWLLLLATADGKITQGCTVEPTEERNCEVCDMMCGLEATLGFELYRDSMKFWNNFNILNYVDIDRCPDWALRMSRLNRK
jgi:MoaA/NifB/PqqE/SkfB family radical SAM enzyme